MHIRHKRLIFRVASLAGAALICLFAAARQHRQEVWPRLYKAPQTADSLTLDDLFGPPTAHDYIIIKGDTVWFDFDTQLAGRKLTDKDYEEVATELGVDAASIKAVVEIETGRTVKGFNEDGTPIVNFDLGVFRKMAAKNKISLGRYNRSHAVVFARPDDRRYGDRQKAQHARLAAAMDIDSLSAIEGTFWGMFQIGGFNWRRCGTGSPEEFVRLMERSERDQLELFAAFIRSSGLLPALQRRDWAAFARGYNGPSYAARGYHRRLADAYSRYSRNKP